MICRIKYVVISKNFFFAFLFSISVKKQTENQDIQFKPPKKAKELKVLDPKSAQNLCKFVSKIIKIYSLNHPKRQRNSRS